MNEIVDATDFRDKKYSVKTMLSFNALSFGRTISLNIFVSRVIFFYEVEILLPISLITIAYIIYTIWDMFNDPLLGHYCDRNYKFTRRYGRRFPWIMIATIPFAVTLILFFIPPDPANNVWLTFLWFLLILCLHDTFTSLLGVNYLAITPNKFRTKEERVRLASFARIFVTAGTVMGFILPALLIVYGDKTTYLPLAIIGALSLIISLVFSIPGLREPEGLIETYFKDDKEEEPFLPEFMATLKKSFKQKNFIVYLILTIALGVHSALLVSSIPYFARYIAKAPPIFEIVVFIPWILMGLILLPFYFWLINKYGHQKVFKYSFLLIPFSTLPLFFSG